MADRQQDPGAPAPGADSDPGQPSTDELIRRGMAIADTMAAMRQLVESCERLVGTMPAEQQGGPGQTLLEGLKGLADTLQTIASDLMPEGTYGQVADAIGREG